MINDFELQTFFPNKTVILHLIDSIKNIKQQTNPRLEIFLLVSLLVSFFSRVGRGILMWRRGEVRQGEGRIKLFTKKATVGQRSRVFFDKHTLSVSG